MMLSDMKKALRINNTAYDDEIEDLIEEARGDLILSGLSESVVNNQVDVDPLIKRAIRTYVKANFGWDNPDYARLQNSYEMLKGHLSLSGDYNAIS
jgi:uncharacterized phage protein (predicted DNA packaging)